MQVVGAKRAGSRYAKMLGILCAMDAGWTLYTVNSWPAVRYFDGERVQFTEVDDSAFKELYGRGLVKPDCWLSSCGITWFSLTEAGRSAARHNGWAAEVPDELERVARLRIVQ